MSESVIAKIVAIHAERTQALEDLLYSLILARTVTYATAGTLGRIGAMVGMPRSAAGPAGDTDETYRPLVLGRIVANASHGQPEAVLAVMRLLGATSVLRRNVYPAGVELQYTGALIVDDATLRALLEQATAPVDLVVSQATAEPFGFDGDPAAFGFGQGEFARSIA